MIPMPICSPYRANFAQFDGRYQWQIRDPILALNFASGGIRDALKCRPYLFEPTHIDFKNHSVVHSRCPVTRHAWTAGLGLYSPPNMHELNAYLRHEGKKRGVGNSTFTELCLLYWILRQEGKLSADAWGVVLRNMWGSRWLALHFCVPSLTADETIKMFELASDEGFHFVNPTIKSKGQLPEIVTIYRGTNTKSPIQETGYSWSTEVVVAEHYLTRKSLWQGTPVLLTARVRRDDILGFLEPQDDDDFATEVILSPRATLMDLKREEISLPAPELDESNLMDTRVLLNTMTKRVDRTAWPYKVPQAVVLPTTTI